MINTPFLTTKNVLSVMGIIVLFSSPFIAQTFAQSSTERFIQSTGDKPGIFETFSQRVSKFMNEKLTVNLALTINEVEAIPNRADALITWNANNLASGKIYYDTVSPVIISSTTPWVPSSQYGNYANSKANIRNLTASTTYFYKVFLEDAEGNRAVSKELSFTTSS